jgi:hypothetical protein
MLTCRLRRLLMGLVVGCCLTAGWSTAAERLAAAEQPRGVDWQVELGFGGQWKLGQPTPIWIRLGAGRVTQPVRLEIEASDADAGSVRYSDPSWRWEPAGPEGAAGEPPIIAARFSHGRADRPVRLRLIGEGQRLLAEATLDQLGVAEPLPATQPWVVVVGGEVDFASRTATGGVAGGRGVARLPPYSLSQPVPLERLPDSMTLYGGVDAVIVVAPAWDLERLADPQRQALVGWLSAGGQLVMSVDPRWAEAPPEAWWRRLLPGTLLATPASVEPGPLESWLAAETQLPPLQACVAELQGAEVTVFTRSRTRQQIPLVARNLVGFGTIDWYFTPIDAGSIAAWDPALRRSLGQRLLAQVGLRGASLRGSEEVEGADNYLGFDDLTGQVRDSLEMFEGVQLVGLFVAGLPILAMLLLVGPLDYWLVAGRLQRPAWTWWSLLSVSVITTAGLLGWSTQTRPGQLRLNGLELWDVDTLGQTVVGRGWGQLYSGEARRLSVAPTVERWTDKDGGATLAAVVDWRGVPGRGLGGFESGFQADLGLPTMRWETVTQSPRDVGIEPGSRLVDLGVAAGGTRSLGWQVGFPWRAEASGSAGGSASWGGDGAAGADASSASGADFRRQRDSDTLVGSWTNPLPVDLLEARLFYRNSAYSLPSRVRSGQTITLTALSNPRDLTRYLQRRRMVGDRERPSPWDPLQRREPDRLVEMLSLYQLAGGASYVGLSHRYLPQLDLSPVLRFDRAVVIARLERPYGELHARDWQPGMAEDGPQVAQRSAAEGWQQAWVRIILPVGGALR